MFFFLSCPSSHFRLGSYGDIFVSRVTKTPAALTAVSKRTQHQLELDPAAEHATLAVVRLLLPAKHGDPYIQCTCLGRDRRYGERAREQESKSENSCGFVAPS